MIPRANSKAQTGNNNRMAGSSQASSGTRAGSKNSPGKSNLGSRLGLLSLDLEDKENAAPKSSNSSSSSKSNLGDASAPKLLRNAITADKLQPGYYNQGSTDLEGSKKEPFSVIINNTNEVGGSASVKEVEFPTFSGLGKAQVTGLCTYFVRVLQEKRYQRALDVAYKILEIEPENKLLKEHLDMLEDICEKERRHSGARDDTSSDGGGDSTSEEDSSDEEGEGDGNVGGPSSSSSAAAIGEGDVAGGR